VYQYRDYYETGYRNPYDYESLAIRNWHYFVKDQNDNEIISGYAKNRNASLTDEQETTAGLYVKYMCLPKNDCYSLVMRDDGVTALGDRVEVSFDNKPIFEDRNISFASVDFGDGCPGVRSCDLDKESTVQIFVSPIQDSRTRAVSWELTDRDATPGSRIIHTGEQSTNYVISLYYDEVCVPKQSCINFSLAEQQNDNKTLGFLGHYLVKMDDVAYQEAYIGTGADLSNHAFHLGENCDPSSSGAGMVAGLATAGVVVVGALIAVGI